MSINKSRTLTASLSFSLALVVSCFNAQAQSIVSPTANPTSIPVAEPTPVLIRAQVVVPAGAAPPASLQLMEQGVAAPVGNLLPSPEGNNVYGARIKLTGGTPGPFSLYVRATLAGASSPVTSAVFTINVYGSTIVSHTIDSSILTGAAYLADEGSGPRPVAALADGNGAVSRFISNQVIFSGSAADASAFASKYSGKVIAQMSAGNLPPTIAPMALIQVDPSQFSANNLDSDASRMGMRGQMKFSSSEAAQLAAFVSGQVAAGVHVVMNFVSDSQGFLWSTTEEADQNGVSNAFAWPEFDARSFEFIAEHGITRRVKLAIIDGGFWLDSSGHPFTNSAGKSDLPASPVEWNPINGTSNASGPNLATCSGGSACPWHGNGSASVALATLNNNAGAAGTGGQVSDPILSIFDGSDFSVAAGVSFAQSQSADIISMSLGGDCNFWCRAGHSLFIDGVMDNALDNGILLVAAAGNSGEDAGDNNTWPCYYSSGAGNGVYCVGALGDNEDSFGYFQSYNYQAKSYSNYGSTVNIWAPTDIHAMPNGSSSGQLVLHNGTSASTPYVAGVAAMIKAMQPSFGPMEIKNIIGHAPFTGGTGISGPLSPFNYPVTVVIQPYQAVLFAAGGYTLKPDVQITSPKNNTVYNPYSKAITFTALAQDVNDGPLTSTVVWTSDVDGILGSGSSTISYDFTNAKEGVRHITVKGTNSYGLSAQDTITITIKFQHIKPTPVILWPKNGMTLNPGTYTVTGWSNLTNPGIDLDNVPCDQVIWNGTVKSTTLPDNTGECEAQLTFAAGTQKITLSASNRLGDTGTTTISVNVVSSSNLTVAIFDPPNNATEYFTFGPAASLQLSGDAAPINAKGAVKYSWYWYMAGASSSTKQLITTSSSTGKSSDTINWTLSKNGLCTGSSTTNITLELDVTETVTSTAALTKSLIAPQDMPVGPHTYTGTTQSNVQLQCMGAPQ